MTFGQELEERTKQAGCVIERYLPAEEGFSRTLRQAMNYSVLAGGKRLRPLMIQSTNRLYGGADALAEPFMAGMEMIHTHSLVHDYLPCMDNDEYRRGKKTTHAVFGEGMATLAGDGLLNLGYETAARSYDLCGGQPESGLMLSRCAHAMKILTEKTGVRGMIGGQSTDVEYDGRELSDEMLDYIYSLKTGALIEASLMIGAVLAGAPGEDVRKLERIGHLVGVAFQIRDDVLDVTGTTEELGKPAGSD